MNIAINTAQSEVEYSDRYLGKYMLRWFYLGGILAACSEDSSKPPAEEANTPPSAAITSHSDGVHDEDEIAGSEGTAADVEDIPSALTVEWFSGADSSAVRRPTKRG